MGPVSLHQFSLQETGLRAGERQRERSESSRSSPFVWGRSLSWLGSNYRPGQVRMGGEVLPTTGRGPLLEMCHEICPHFIVCAWASITAPSCSIYMNKEEQKPPAGLPGPSPPTQSMVI